MSSRHQELNGADSEPLSTYDASCDYCARTTYGGCLRTVTIGPSISLLCDTCYQRQQDEYERMVVPDSATFDEWMSWTGINQRGTH